MNNQAILHAQKSQVAEVTLLLPRQQAVALEEVARFSGMTIGQVLRQMVADCLSKNSQLSNECGQQA